MARSVTLAQMRTTALRLADMETSGFVGTSEANDAINSAIAEVWDDLIENNQADEFSSDFSITTTAGTASYSLPSDFRSAVALYALEASDGSRRPVMLINNFDRAYHKNPTGAYSLNLEYVPAPPTLSSDSDTFDGISGFEKLVIALAARDFLIKEESDISAVEAVIQDIRRRISGYSRSKGPRLLTDVDAIDARIYPTTIGIRGYRIRGSNIEVYEPVLPLMVPT